MEEKILRYADSKLVSDGRRTDVRTGGRTDVLCKANVIWVSNRAPSAVTSVAAATRQSLPAAARELAASLHT